MIFGVIVIVGLGMALREMPLPAFGLCHDDVPARVCWPAFSDALQQELDGLVKPATTRVARVAVPKQSYACRHWHGVWLRDWG